ncbi:bifunctional glucose-6-phosphate/mannose-6-phosphate isomerase [Marmoricola endophyticus]|uniref:Bifunctional glucose-6-phosphate/mannose-6-phosphate isomerase n=1 Tax=Marmoricola endophyticus TaxID=2040280 RepID=A0A917BRP8_9ACTN|nr:SIS domain-containing protein [Marmoricola endophyticus]GGF56449.1 bifunctional glucose-6-phosphate/mannose-6-phosphate isomerase [Marmoricola endophyticus]
MFDDHLLDDEAALRRVDLRLRHLAESGARVRSDAYSAADAVEVGADRLAGNRPRALIAVGPEARLLRAVLEPTCPVPFVAWPHATDGGPRLPSWAGSLDLVVVLAPAGDHPESAAAVTEGLRRGCSLVLVAPPRSLAAEPLEDGPRAAVDRVHLPTGSGDPLGACVAALGLLGRLGLAPREDPEAVAAALDAVAVDCSPYRDLATNRAKSVASAVADTTPLVWGGSVAAARAARRTAEAVRRTTGRACLAGDVEQLLPVLEQSHGRDVFADPFEDEDVPAPPSLVLLDDGADEPGPLAARNALVSVADERALRVEVLETEPAGGSLSRYAALVSLGDYTATYLDAGTT